MNLFQSQDPVTASWLFALTILFVIVVALPMLRLIASGVLYGVAAITGRHQLRAAAARVMPRLGHVLGSVIVGIASVAAPTTAAAEVTDASISVDRDGGLRALNTETLPTTTAARAETVTAAVPAVETVASTPEQRGSALYIVKTGDSLWDIAASRLDEPTHAEITETWKAIWRANRITIGDHPELIRPGMELVLEGVES